MIPQNEEAQSALKVSNALMVELVDTLVLEASAERRASSSLAWGTKQMNGSAAIC